MADIPVGIKDLLVAAGVGVFAAPTGWSIHIGLAPNKPDSVISIWPSGGNNPNPKWSLDYPQAQVRVRDKKWEEAYAKTQQVKDTLLGIPSQDLNGDRWNSITMIGDLTSMGYDEKNRPEFSLNFALIVEPADGGNRLPL